MAVIQGAGSIEDLYGAFPYLKNTLKDWSGIIHFTDLGLIEKIIKKVTDITEDEGLRINLVNDLIIYSTDNPEVEENLDNKLAECINERALIFKPEIIAENIYAQEVLPVINNLENLLGNNFIEYAESIGQMVINTLIDEHPEEASNKELMLAKVIMYGQADYKGNECRDVNNLAGLMRKAYLRNELSKPLLKAYNAARIDKNGFINSRITSNRRLAYHVAYALLHSKGLNVVKDYDKLRKADKILND